MDRANKKCNTLWHNEWMFAFEDDDYGDYIPYEPYDGSLRHGVKTTLSNGDVVMTFNSKNKAVQFLGLKKKGSLVEGAIIKGYEIHFVS